MRHNKDGWAAARRPGQVEAETLRRTRPLVDMSSSLTPLNRLVSSSGSGSSSLSSSSPLPGSLSKNVTYGSSSSGSGQPGIHLSVYTPMSHGEQQGVLRLGTMFYLRGRVE